jgi:hypothetical protein
MKDTSIYAYKPQITVTEARNVLGTAAKGLTDNAISQLVAQVDILTDIVIAHINDSTIQSSIDISTNKSHTDE